MKKRVVGELCEALAKFIEDQPSGAAYAARKLSVVLCQQADLEDAEERERLDLEDAEERERLEEERERLARACRCGGL